MSKNEKYAKIVSDIRIAACGAEKPSSHLLLMQLAADAIEELLGQHEADAKEIEWLKKCVQDLPKPPRWISVEYELPSRYETVLLNIQTCKDSYVTIGDYEPNELRFRDFSDRNNQVYCGDIVTHWMPLPEPPKEVYDEV